MEEPKFAFKGKYIVLADIELITALHIGGTEEGFEIGGLDNPVIKDPMTGAPFIPGSSLKGKMRSLLEWAHDLVKDEIKKDKQNNWQAGPTTKPNDVGIVFGIAAEALKGDTIPGPTRLTVCDAYPNQDQIETWEKSMGDGIFTELKTENTICRLTSAATPRPMERVPARSVFKARFIFDIFEEDDFNRLKILSQGMRLLEDSALGGGGSRGSGRIRFKKIKIKARHKGYYLGTDEKTLKEIESKAYESAAEFDKTLKKMGNDAV